MFTNRPDSSVLATSSRDVEIIASLEGVNTPEEFRFWVRRYLRRVMPHACFLATIGTLHGQGSFPTHRLTADFPLSVLEELKNSSGAIVDPAVVRWFKTARSVFLEVEDKVDDVAYNGWAKVMRRYGMKNVLVHGTFDHKNRKFVMFQLTNVFSSDPVKTAETFRTVLPHVSSGASRVMMNMSQGVSVMAYGDPTFSLTPAELHIVELLARGLSNKQIARLRGVSDSTVKTQVQRTGAKLGATRRAEIVAIAMPFLRALPPQSIIDYD